MLVIDSLYAARAKRTKPLNRLYIQLSWLAIPYVRVWSE